MFGATLCLTSRWVKDGKADFQTSVIVFQIWRWLIVATPREIRWYWWPVTVLTYLKNQSHASGQVIHEVAMEEPQTWVEEQHTSD